MSNASDFVIKNGVLKDYIGPGGDVVIPEGVTSIGESAFRWCSSLTSVIIPDSVTNIGDEAFKDCRCLMSVVIPEGVTSIGDCAFYGCSSLMSVVIPDGVTSIGEEAFSGCRRLTSVVIPDSVTNIGSSAFSGCGEVVFQISNEAANRPANFVIENGVMKKYDGPGGDVVIPEGVTSIGDSAFSLCSSLTSVVIPESVTSIGNEAFWGCSSLTSVTIPDSVTSIGDEAFDRCGRLTSITLPEGMTSIGNSIFPDSLQIIRLKGADLKIITNKLFQNYYSTNVIVIYSIEENPEYLLLIIKNSLSSSYGWDNFIEFVLPGNWTGYDLDLMNKRHTLSIRLLGAWARLASPTGLSEENRIHYVQLLQKNVKKIMPIAEEYKMPEIITKLLSFGILDKKKLTVLRKMLAESKMPEIAALAEMEAEVAEVQTKKSTSQKSPLQREYAERLKAIQGNQTIKKMKLPEGSFPTVLLKNGTEAPSELLCFVLASYGQQYGGEYHMNEEADAAAALLSKDSLCEALEKISGLHGPNYPRVLPVLCRFGSEVQIRTLTKEWKNWGLWGKYGKRGRTAQEVLLDALVLSDTKEAVIWLDKKSALGAYASIRGISVDTVRDKYFSDVGIDEQGGKTYDLGNQTVTARLQQDLSYRVELPNGKSMKSLPKKGADEEKYKAAKTDFDQMRKDSKKILKNRGSVLFKDFLSGRSRPANEWKDAYLKNPLLRKAASLIVWAQGDRTFTLRDGSPIDSSEQPYTITDAPIKVAHPMEMEESDTTAWQKFFVVNKVKQPFVQVWEPAIDPSTVYRDRYKGAMIPYYRFLGQEKHGITVEDHDFHNDIHIDLEGCNALVEQIDWHRHDINMEDRFEIKSFDFKQYTRQVNHLVVYFDSLTVWDRVKKDDISVMELMGKFTLAQITEFIAAAQEANAVNVLAALLEYKNNKFSDFDPMEEFTLEW